MIFQNGRLEVRWTLGMPEKSYCRKKKKKSAGEFGTFCDTSDIFIFFSVQAGNETKWEPKWVRADCSGTHFWPLMTCSG